MTPSRNAARLAGFVSVNLALAGLAFAQETGKGKEEAGEPEEELPRIEIPDLTGEGEQDDQQEMIRLFHEVERTLEAIDVELSDAGAGRVPTPEGRESGIDRLLRSHGQKSQQAVSGIEQILEVAQRMSGQSGGT
jgi:hypothetical protein